MASEKRSARFPSGPPSSFGLPPKPKSAVIAPMPRTMSVQKSDSFKRLAHEPARGAVWPADRAAGSDRGATPVQTGLQGTMESRGGAGQASRGAGQKQRSGDSSGPSTATRLSSESSTAAYTTLSSSVNHTSNLTSSQTSSHTFSQTSSHTSSQTSGPYGALPALDWRAGSDPSAVKPRQSHTEAAVSATGRRGLAVQLTGSGCVEGRSGGGGGGRVGGRGWDGEQGGGNEQGGAGVGQLMGRVRELEGQLEVQSKVNADIKKLLVASIGDDLHYKVDALVRTKVQLSNEIGDYTRKLVEDYEDLDKVSIQADLWHSKYQASRLLAEQRTEEKDALAQSCAETQTALGALMEERLTLHAQLHTLHQGLQLLHRAFAPSAAAAAAAAQHPAHSLALVRSSSTLLDDICFTLLGSRPSLTVGARTGGACALGGALTPAERHAWQVMSMADKNIQVSSASGAVYGSSNRVLPFARFHPGARYDGFTLACCRHCKGEIHVV